MNRAVLMYDIKYGMLILIFFFLCYLSYKFIRGYLRARKAAQQPAPAAEPEQSTTEAIQ